TLPSIRSSCTIRTWPTCMRSTPLSRRGHACPCSRSWHPKRWLSPRGISREGLGASCATETPSDGGNCENGTEALDDAGATASGSGRVRSGRVGARSTREDVGQVSGDGVGLVLEQGRGRDPNRRLGAEPPALAGDNGPAALQQSADGRCLLGDSDPDIEARRAVSCDASTGEGVEAAPASRGIDVGSLLELLPHGLVLPQVGDEFLQDVADPAGAEQLAALG